MKIKNNKGQERDTKLLFEIEKDKNKYLIYEDYITNKIYSGKLNNDKLEIINDKEYEFLNNILERIEG